MVFGLFRKKQEHVPSSDSLDVKDAKKVSMGCIVAMHIIAATDGYVSPEELEMIVEITGAYKRGLMSPQEILDLVANTQAMVCEGGEPGWRALFESFHPLDPADQKFIMHSAATVALADKFLARAEFAMIEKMGIWMATSEATMSEWRSEFDERLAEMRADGLTIVIE